MKSTRIVLRLSVASRRIRLNCWSNPAFYRLLSYPSILKMREIGRRDQWVRPIWQGTRRGIWALGHALPRLCGRVCYRLQTSHFLWDLSLPDYAIDMGELFYWQSRLKERLNRTSLQSPHLGDRPLIGDVRNHWSATLDRLWLERDRLWLERDQKGQLRASLGVSPRLPVRSRQSIVRLSIRIRGPLPRRVERGLFPIRDLISRSIRHVVIPGFAELDPVVECRLAEQVCRYLESEKRPPPDCGSALDPVSV